MKTITLFLLAMAMLIAGCSDTVHGREIAEPEVAIFHDRLDAGKFDLIYENASPEFKNAVSKQKIQALFGAIERKLGKLKSSKQSNWNLRSFNGVTTVVLTYDTEFKEGNATETFTYRVSDGTAQLLGYNIASLDMLIK